MILLRPRTATFTELPMPAQTRNKPPILIGNLLQVGWKDTARSIYREARQLNVLVLAVYVDEHQDVWIERIRKTSTIDQTHWIATYGCDVVINEVEDDLLHHLQTFTQEAMA